MRAGYLRFELQTIDVHLPLARGEKRPVVKLCSPYLGYMLGWIPAFFYGGDDITASITSGSTETSEVTPARLSPDRMVRVYLKRVTKSVYRRLRAVVGHDLPGCIFVCVCVCTYESVSTNEFVSTHGAYVQH